MFETFKEIFPLEYLKFNEPMKEHTTFRTGGPASLFIEPLSIEEIIQSIQHCLQKKYPYEIIGAGSNLLISDEGYDGIIIKVGEKVKKIEIKNTVIYAEAGISLAELARKAARAGLTGLEFAEGIPGKLGGGLFMNAGAYGGELNDLVEEIETLNLETGKEETLSNVQKEIFGYRTSYFQNHPYLILKASLKLKQGSQEEIKNKMKMLAEKRRLSQPLNFPSAGSTFKRPKEEGKYAGALIEQAGLKGMNIGGAKVSEKHAGFIINYNQATSNDIWKLIQQVQKKVFDCSGIILEPEVRFIGKF